MLKVLLSKPERRGFSIPYNMYPLLKPEWELKSVQHRGTTILCLRVWDRGNNFSKSGFHDTERLTSRHILFPLLGSNHKRHGTGRLHRRKRWDASLLSTDDHLIPPPISSLLTQGVPGHELGISTLAEQLKGTPISHSTFGTWILETRVIKTNLRSVSVLWIISIETL